MPAVVEDSLDSGALTTHELPTAVAEKLRLDRETGGQSSHTIRQELKVWLRALHDPQYTIADISGGHHAVVTVISKNQRDIGAKLAEAETANAALLTYPATRDIATTNGTLLDSVKAMWGGEISPPTKA